MICQADRAYVLASADWLQTKGMFGSLDPGPCCYRARDDTAINHELPSWAAFPKTVGPWFWRWRAWFAKLHWPPYMYAHLCVHKDLRTCIKHIKEEHPWCRIHTSAAVIWSNCFQSTNTRRKGSGMDEKFFRSIEGMIKFDEVFLIIFILGNKWYKNGTRLRFFFPGMCFVSLFFWMLTEPQGKGAVDKVVTLQSLLSPSSQNPANGAFQYNFIKNLQRADVFVTAFLQPDFAAQVQRHEKQMENNYRGLWHWSQFYFLKIGLNIMFVMSCV